MDLVTATDESVSADEGSKLRSQLLEAMRADFGEPV
jgi:hypothetical protein